MNRKVDTTWDSDCTEFTEKAGTDLESIDSIDWLELFGYYGHTGKLLSKLYSSNLSITLRKIKA